MTETGRRVIYCSGPLFSPEEVETMAAISRLLEEQGFETFLPHRDGLEAYAMNGVNNPLVNALVFRPLAKLISKGIFALDVYQVAVRCDGFLFNMNGRVPDEGAAAEAAMAYIFGKPVVIYKNDGRSWCGSFDHPVLTGAAASRVCDLQQIPGAVARALAAVLPDGARGDPSYSLYLRKVILRGGRIWKALRAAAPLRPRNKMSRC